MNISIVAEDLSVSYFISLRDMGAVDRPKSLYFNRLEIEIAEFCEPFTNVGSIEDINIFRLNLGQSHYYKLITMQVKDLTTDELKHLIRATVVEVLGDILPDPDRGLIVKQEFKQELLKIQRRRKAGNRGIAAAAMKKLELDV
jgi:hypothetical protein